MGRNKTMEPIDMSNKETGPQLSKVDTITVTVITWGALLLGLLFVLMYLNCQRTGDRISECIKAGEGPVACGKTFDPDNRR